MREPAVVECECGQDVSCKLYENECHCGAVYSQFGIINFSKSNKPKMFETPKVRVYRVID